MRMWNSPTSEAVPKVRVRSLVSRLPGDARTTRLQCGDGGPSTLSPSPVHLVVCRRQTTSMPTEQPTERLAKVRLEDGVENRVDGRVDVAEPEEERVESAWNAAQSAPSVDDVDREEAHPRSTENGHYDGGSDCSSRLEMFGVARAPPPSCHETYTQQINKRNAAAYCI